MAPAGKPASTTAQKAPASATASKAPAKTVADKKTAKKSTSSGDGEKKKKRKKKRDVSEAETVDTADHQPDTAERTTQLHEEAS